MNERQTRALQHLEEHGRITASDYRELCPGIPEVTTSLGFTDLMDKGLLLKVGAKSGT